MLDKWTSSNTAKLGVDLTFQPIQFKDSSGKPAGYQMDITGQMMKDLGVTPEYVEIAFGQLFAAVVSGQVDMMGISATILPSRGLKGLFADFPCFYESIVILLRPGSKITSPSQLNASGITISTVQGTAQEGAGKLLYPNATNTAFTAIADSINAVGTGRADAVILSEFDVESAFAAHKDLKIMPGPPLFSDANTYFIPLGLCRLSPFAPVSALAYVYVQIFRALSLYVYILWIYFGLPAFVGIRLSPFQAAVVALTPLNSTYMAEIYRAAIRSIDMGQWEASRSLGMNPIWAFFAIILPQAWRVAVPALVNQFTDIIKDTSIVALIGAGDMMYRTTVLAAFYNRPFEFYTTIGLIYFALVVIVAQNANPLERRLRLPAT